MPKQAKQPEPPNSTTSPSRASPFKRLPVNPRRKKVAPDQRKRVATACNRCNLKRIKCSGDQPCRQCVHGGRDCIYPPPVEKVTLTRAELDDLKAQLREFKAKARHANAMRRLLEEHSIPLPPESDSLPASPSGSSPMDADTMDCDPEPSDAQEEREQGKLLMDSDGTKRFMGGPSGAIYLNNLKDLIQTTHTLAGTPNQFSSFLTSKDRYQTADSRPLNLPTVDLTWRPSAAEVNAMLAQISGYIQDGQGAFKTTGGILYWPWKDINTVTSGSPPSPNACRRLALYHAGFAFSCLIKGEPSEQHFSRAWTLLGNPADVARLTSDDVPALALMALYLVEINRRETAHVCISNAVQMAGRAGAYTRIQGDEHEDDPVAESWRRTFGTVFILDRWVSCLVGRPPTVHQYAAANLPSPKHVAGLPSPVGLAAHIDLSDIYEHILDHSYQARLPRDNYKLVDKVLGKPKREQLSSEGQQHEQDVEADAVLTRPGDCDDGPLSTWRENLPADLKLRDLSCCANPFFSQYQGLGDIEPDAKNVDRAYLSLQMIYNQLVILTVRPAFLTAVKRLIADRLLGIEYSEKNAIENHDYAMAFRQSSDAARDNLLIGRHIRAHVAKPWNKLLASDLHYIFNAAILLLMARLSFSNWRALDDNHVSFAKQVFDEARASGSEYAKDCLDDLVALESLVKWLREKIFSPDRASLSQGGTEYKQVIHRLDSWQRDDPRKSDEREKNTNHGGE